MTSKTQAQNSDGAMNVTERITDKTSRRRSSTGSVTPSPDSDTKPKQMRGFARMNKEKLRRIASEGGIAAQNSKTANRFTSTTARKAGKVGGFRIAQDRDYMTELGRRGGLAKGVSMARKRAAQAAEQGRDVTTGSSSPVE